MMWVEPGPFCVKTFCYMGGVNPLAFVVRQECKYHQQQPAPCLTYLGTGSIPQPWFDHENPSDSKCVRAKRGDKAPAIGSALISNGDPLSSNINNIVHVRNLDFGAVCAHLSTALWPLDGRFWAGWGFTYPLVPSLWDWLVAQEGVREPWLGSKQQSKRQKAGHAMQTAWTFIQAKASVEQGDRCWLAMLQEHTGQCVKQGTCFSQSSPPAFPHGWH